MRGSAASCSLVSRPRWQSGLGQRPNSSSRVRQNVQCVASHQTKYVMAAAAASIRLTGSISSISPRRIARRSIASPVQVEKVASRAGCWAAPLLSHRQNVATPVAATDRAGLMGRARAAALMADYEIRNGHGQMGTAAALA